jgi:molecular chaperone HscB
LATISAVLDGRKNYFDLFDLPIAFSVDSTRLSERYRTLIDSGQTPFYRDEGRASVFAPVRPQIEIELAYRTLVDPLTRAAYLVDLLDDQRDSTDGRSRLGFDLMAEMELRESLAETSNRPDPDAAVANVLTELAEQGASLEKDLQRLLADPSPRDLEAAREILRRLEIVGAYRRDAEDRRAALARRS